jgi:glycosyltransferase involved in cell wall biosynthesis
MPRVSICLPVLNAQPFLKERLDSILHQTFQDWELVVCDSYSVDGSWEFLQRFEMDSRVKLFQVPREGIYAGINACINKACGEFIYIATADDTMMPDCLVKMVTALDAHPECGIVHCGLRIIDEQGLDFPEHSQWTQSYACRYFKKLMSVEHIRYAPHDGLLHFALATVYASLSQLLVRRSVFVRVGLFDAKFGAAGDFEWDMRASLVENTVHIPDYLATWRVHATQATKNTETAHSRASLQRMARTAFRRARKIEPSLLGGISLFACEYAYDCEWLWFAFKEARSRRARITVLLAAVLYRPRTFAVFVLRFLRGEHFLRLDVNHWCAEMLLRLGVAAPRVFSVSETMKVK